MKSSAARLRQSKKKAAEQDSQAHPLAKDEISQERAAFQFAIGAIQAAVLTPILFYLRFGQVGPLGWGTTVFFVVYSLLAALGLHFGSRTEYHTQVKLRGDWRDRIGAFWLVGCLFGPFFGWIITSGVFPITQSSWRYMYGARVLLSAALPAILALPLFRYARGKSALIALPLLIVVTLLPVSSAMNVSLDLWEGPISQQSQVSGQQQMLLKHSGRVFPVE